MPHIYQFSCDQCGLISHAHDSKIMSSHICDNCGNNFVPGQTKNITQVKLPQKPAAPKSKLTQTKRVSRTNLRPDDTYRRRNKRAKRSRSSSSFLILSIFHWGILAALCVASMNTPPNPDKAMGFAFLGILFGVVYLLPLVAGFKGMNVWFWWCVSLIYVVLYFNRIIGLSLILYFGTFIILLALPRMKLCGKCYTRIDYRASICSRCGSGV